MEVLETMVEQSLVLHNKFRRRLNADTAGTGDWESITVDSTTGFDARTI